MRRRVPIRERKGETGFTLTEMLIAMVVVIFGLVAVAQLVPSSVMMSSANRNDGTAVVFAQRQMEVMRAQPLSALNFTDPPNGGTCPAGQICGVSCPTGQTCLLGDPTQPPLTQVGCPVAMFNGTPVIDFSQPASSCPSGYQFSYLDPNDPSGASYDVRWMVVTNVNLSQVVISRRIILGVFRRGMQTPTLPVTLDVQVEK
jgi:type II secretory pathway pseudopilin PulG